MFNSKVDKAIKITEELIKIYQPSNIEETKVLLESGSLLLEMF